MDAHGIERFVRYSVIGGATLLFDLGLLWFYVSIVGLHYVVATMLAFFIAVSINYLLSRRYVFLRTERSFEWGYLFFVKFALIAAFVTAGCMWIAVEYFGLELLIARIGVAGVVGILNYLFNLYVNFKVAGVSMEE